MTQYLAHTAASKLSVSAEKGHGSSTEDAGGSHDALQDQVADLFERLRLPVYRYLVVMVGQTGEAEELTHEAFIRLRDYLQTGHPPAEARFWLFRVAHNLAVNALRRRGLVASVEATAWTELCSRAAAGPDPEHLLLDHERRRRLAAAIGTLPLQQRQCLALRAEGLRYREIAELQGVSYTTVVECLRRGVAKLAKALHDETL